MTNPPLAGLGSFLMNALSLSNRLGVRITRLEMSKPDVGLWS